MTIYKRSEVFIPRSTIVEAYGKEIQHIRAAKFSNPNNKNYP